MMDVRLPGRSGIDATRDIVAALPETKVINLPSFADGDLVMDAVAAVRPRRTPRSAACQVSATPDRAGRERTRC